MRPNLIGEVEALYDYKVICSTPTHVWAIIIFQYWLWYNYSLFTEQRTNGKKLDACKSWIKSPMRTGLDIHSVEKAQF